MNYQVLFIKPEPVDGVVDLLRDEYGVPSTPPIEVAFYVDLGIKAVLAVNKMMSDGSWPSLDYTKCREKSDYNPIMRNLNLVAAMQVKNQFNKNKLISPSLVLQFPQYLGRILL